jgi:hypothetical protein
MEKFWKPPVSYILVIASLFFFRAQAEVTIFDTVNSVDSLQSEVISTEFKNSAIEYFNDLKLLGIDKIQNKSIESIIAHIKNIKILVVTEIKFKNNDLLNTSRNCAYWDQELKLIVISSFNWVKLKPDGKRSIAAHEVLGLLGLQDNQFEITALVEAYSMIELINQKTSNNPSSQMKIDADSLNLFKNLIKEPDAFIISGGGGVSGVGGGGDMRPLQYKAFLINQAFLSFNFKEINYADFIKFIKIYQTINIEFSNDIKQGSYLIYPENLTVYVPNNPFNAQNYSINNRAALELHLRLVEKMKSGQK